MTARRSTPRPRLINRPKVRSEAKKTAKELAKLEKERATIQKQQDKLEIKATSLDIKIQQKKNKISTLEEAWRISEQMTTRRRGASNEDD